MTYKTTVDPIFCLSLFFLYWLIGNISRFHHNFNPVRVLLPSYLLHAPIGLLTQKWVLLMLCLQQKWVPYLLKSYFKLQNNINEFSTPLESLLLKKKLQTSLGPPNVNVVSPTEMSSSNPTKIYVPRTLTPLKLLLQIYSNLFSLKSKGYCYFDSPSPSFSLSLTQLLPRPQNPAPWWRFPIETNRHIATAIHSLGQSQRGFHGH